MSTLKILTVAEDNHAADRLTALMTSNHQGQGVYLKISITSTGGISMESDYPIRGQWHQKHKVAFPVVNINDMIEFLQEAVIYLKEEETVRVLMGINEKK